MNRGKTNPTLAIRYGIITKEEAADPYAIVEKKANLIQKIQNLLVIEIQIDKKVLHLITQCLIKLHTNPEVILD